MPNFHKQYSDLFATFGSPLGKSHGVDTAILDKAEKKLGVAIPESLRAYYEVAGNERRFNQSMQRFQSPSNWFVDQKQLVFLDENQSVCQWGVSIKTKGAKDPMVSQGVDHGENLVWHKEHNRCSIFISVILHYQAVSDGFKHCASGAAPDDAHEKLKQGRWKYVGEVNQLWAFNRPNQVVCIMPSGGLPFMPSMMLMAGGKTAGDLKSISESLGVSLS
jgi:hypothetical protein